MAPEAQTSIFRKTRNNNDAAILVTGPRTSERESLTLVEGETCEVVDVSSENPFRRLLTSGLAAVTRQGSAEEKELAEVSKRDDPVQISSPDTKPESIENYDTCREYSCDSDDAELNSRYFNTNGSSNSAPINNLAAVYVLGKIYHPINDYDARRDDESALFWFTYRCDFPCIEPYGISSDAGWGCMLRALQMMMGQALRLHYKSRDWRPQQSLASRRSDPFLRSIMTWFADFPSSSESVYSLHNMVATGLAKYDKLPGEWYGPGTACYVLRDLVDMHENLYRNDQHRRMFRVHVASGGTVYRDVIDETMTRESRARLAKLKQEKSGELPPPAHPLDVAWEDELLDPLASDSSRLEWDTALLLLIPLRLGLKNFNSDYVEALANTFSLRQSVGVLGGRPRGARWFYGALSDGSKTFGLDPHTVQSAPKRRQALVNGKTASVVELSDEYMRSIHTTHPEICSLAKLDPSIALGFYCRNKAELASVFSSLRQWREEHADSPELFAVADKSPDYSSNIAASAMESMLESVMDSDDEGDASEEDEYVVL